MIADAFTGLDAADDLDPVAHALADRQLAECELAAVHHEDAVDAVAVLQRAYGTVSTVSILPLSMCTRAKVPGLSTASVLGTSASNGNARVEVFTAGLIRETLPVNVAVLIRVDLQIDRPGRW